MKPMSIFGTRPEIVRLYELLHGTLMRHNARMESRGETEDCWTHIAP
jgi:UDP-N-acetylglucosamine 2-epimerase